jgi:hypothetical protein
VKIYVDQADKLAGNDQRDLGDEDLVGEVVVDADWPSGYGAMTAAVFPLHSSRE